MSSLKDGANHLADNSKDRFQALFKNELISQFLENHHCVIDEALTPEFAFELKKEIHQLNENKLFRNARIGGGNSKDLRQDIRSDQILWIEPTHGPLSASLLKTLDAWRQQLNQEFFLSLNQFEAHYALYPPKGFYDRHLDQTAKDQTQSKRLISFILYLNEGWQKDHGGELTLFNPIHKTVEPLFNRLVLFRSDIVEHRVEVSYHDRWSICGWMRTGSHI